jgi:phytoene dehydrogenase-like protein
LQGVVALIAQVPTAVGGLTILLSSHLKAGNTVLSHLGDAYEKVRKARAKVEATGDAARTQAALKGRRQAEEEAEGNLREIELKIQALNSEIAELGPGRQLIRFLQERAAAEGYRNHLGLVSFIRKDYQQLSDLLLKASEGNDKDRSIVFLTGPGSSIPAVSFRTHLIS